MQDRSRKGHNKRDGRKRRNRDDSDSSSATSSSSRSPTRIIASDRPKYVKSRIFVANINSKETNKLELTKRFSKYGDVSGE